MKRFLPFILTGLLFGQDVIQIKTGTSFGECYGYCLSELSIIGTDADYYLNSWIENDSVYQPVEISNVIDFSIWENLYTFLDFELFMNLDTIYGCPDCADGGAEWFEIATNDTIKRVTIEFGDSLDGFNNFIDLLRSVRYSFQEIQACYYIPQTGPCDAAFLRFYYDQEENQCMEFSWGGCAGLVPFDTLEDCESNCNDNELLSQTGYLRKTEASLCMDSCSVYYLEDEYGEFLTHVTQLDSIEILNDYINRFVEVEGDTVQCVECEAINVTSIEISDECEFPVACFADPCSVSNCYSYPEADCVANYCGGCWSDYYLDGELIQCGVPEGCIDLTGIDFGLCDMGLGVGWINNHCESISGCDWIATNPWIGSSVDYTEAFFTSMDDCQQTCMVLHKENDLLLPLSYSLYSNYPNPFNPVTNLNYDLPQDSFVKITIYDMLGRKVKTLINQTQDAGYRSVVWNATNDYGKPVSAGIYLYQIQAGEYISTKKMVLLK